MSRPDMNPVDPPCRCGDCLAVDKNGADLSRRGFLANTIVGAAAVMAGATVLPVTPAMAQSTMTPDAALKALMDGNQRASRENSSLQRELVDPQGQDCREQEPFAAVLSCADSRVPVEIVFDQSIGQLFVVRLAGNIATPEVIASLEYGVAVLGTKVLMVLGHGNCGAVKAAIEGKAVPGQISALYAPIRMAVDKAGPNLDAAIDANAKIQADLLSKASVIIGGAIKEGKLKVVPARYDLASGKVSLLT